MIKCGRACIQYYNLQLKNGTLDDRVADDHSPRDQQAMVTVTFSEQSRIDETVGCS
jgi:hypothetical protein